MSCDDLVTELRKRAPDIRALGAISLYLFGSAARGETTETSDVELFIDYDPEKFSFVELIRGRFDYLRRGRRTALTFPLLPPPQKNRSPPSDSSPDTPTPGGISSLSRTCPVRGSTRLTSLSSPSQVPCQSSPSIQVTPVTKRLDSIVRRIAPVWGST